MTLDASVRRAARELSRTVSGLEFSAPVSHVYNPLDYAWRGHAEYLRRYAATPKRVVFLGMNPGPYGMAQTGVPFGEVAHVRGWLGIETPIDKPAREHPKRPVLGFECTRSEVSGGRLWGAIAEHYTTPEAFFTHSIVLNYCPLVFMETSGRNITPDKIRRPEAEPLFEACDRHLRRVVRLLEPHWVIGVGRFAAQRAQDALSGAKLRLGQVLHPSPASPRANRGWASEARRELTHLGVCSGGGAACGGSGGGTPARRGSAEHESTA